MITDEHGATVETYTALTRIAAALDHRFPMGNDPYARVSRLSSPLRTAWELAKAWPDAELTVIDDSGHTGSPAMATATTKATNRFARTPH